MKSSLNSLIPFLPLFCNCQLNSVPLLPSSYPSRLASRHSTTVLFAVAKVKVTLRLTVSQSVSVGVEPHLGAHDQIFITVWQLRSCFSSGALSDEKTGLSFVYAAGPCQRSLSRVRVPWDLRPYFTVSDLRLRFSSLPTTRRVTVPASTGSSRSRLLCSFITPRHGPHRK
jgi:hypothetical protein